MTRMASVVQPRTSAEPRYQLAWKAGGRFAGFSLSLQLQAGLLEEPREGRLNQAD
jgi:hypothetical protein